MFSGVIDKLLFTVLFVLLLQVPSVTSGYVNYIEKLQTATQQLTQVSGPDVYAYKDANSMLYDWLTHDIPSISEDVKSKMKLIRSQQQLLADKQYLEQANFAQQAIFFANPLIWPVVRAIGQEYQFSLSFKLKHIGFAFGLTWLTMMLLKLPFSLRSSKKSATNERAIFGRSSSW